MSKFVSDRRFSAQFNIISYYVRRYYVATGFNLLEDLNMLLSRKFDDASMFDDVLTVILYTLIVLIRIISAKQETGLEVILFMKTDVESMSEYKFVMDYLSRILVIYRVELSTCIEFPGMQVIRVTLDTKKCLSFISSGNSRFKQLPTELVSEVKLLL